MSGLFKGKEQSVAKPRYEILDGLRGVAAVMVVWFHFFEAFATSTVDQRINHGYLAVDFFFVLSGFVLGYAYKDRWKEGLTAGRFMLRRIIRLEPMVVFGAVLGAVSFVMSGCVKWDGSSVSVTAVVISLLCGIFMIPAWPGSVVDVRGYTEMFPLNGPSWSLFFEYIGSLLYATVLYRMSTKMLSFFVALTGAALAATAFADLSGTYHIGNGWSLAGWGSLMGFLRLAFSFSAGLLLSRVFRPRRINGAFWIAAIVIVAVMVCPYAGGSEPSVMNAVYDSVCSLIVFPAVVALGACGVTTDRWSTAVCGFVGRISYPLYITHYPVMYLFYAWVWKNNIPYENALPVCALLFVGIVIIAWAAMRYYDEPVRRLLINRFRSRL